MNLLVQGAVFMLLAMGEVFVLLLGEIDLSIGFVAAIGGVIMAELVGPGARLAVVGGDRRGALLACAAIGLLQGLIITRLGLPSFVVTLAGLLFWQGVMLLILGNGGTIPINDTVINDIASNEPDARRELDRDARDRRPVRPASSWRRDAKRRRAGLVAPPPTDHAAQDRRRRSPAASASSLICNAEPRHPRARSRASRGSCCSCSACSALWTFLLGRTKFGRYIYAIGGNAEAARRAGINLAAIRTPAFMLCSFTAGHRRDRLRLAAALDLDHRSTAARSSSTPSPPRSSAARACSAAAARPCTACSAAS